MSRVALNGTIPWVLTRPTVTLRPVSPQKVAGRRTEPPVSVPMPQGAMRAATRTPVPLLDPPGVRATARSRGFQGVPRCSVGAPHAVGELDGVGLAQHDHPVSHQPLGDGGRGAGAAGPVLVRATHGDPTGGVDQVLEHRHPVQGAGGVTGPDRPVGGKA